MEDEWVNLGEDLQTGWGARGAARHQLRDRGLGNGESQRERERRSPYKVPLRGRLTLQLSCASS